MKFNLKLFKLLSTVAITVAVPLSQTAHAALEEIVVTAQKRSQSLQDVPISIAAFTGKMLEEAGVDSVNDLATMVPGLRIDQQGAFSQPTIRGVGSSTAGAGFTSNVATYIDGFYSPSQLTTDMQLLNLKSVQVLKGPQGTLFGRNATGGAILLETSDPSFDPIFEAKLSVGSYDKKGLNFYGSTGLSETLAIDIAGIVSKGDGYLKDLINGKDDLGKFTRESYRISAMYRPSDTLQIELALSKSEVDDPLHNLKGAWNGHTLGALLGPLFGITPIIADGHREVANSALTVFTSENESAQLTIEKEFNGMVFKSFTMTRNEDTHSDLDLDSSNVPVFGVEFTVDNETFTQEFNLSGSTDKLDWIVGAFYMEHDEGYTNLAATESASPSFPPGTAIYNNIGNDIKSTALFADLTYQLNDKLYLTAGLRYSAEEAKAFVNGLGTAVGRINIPEWKEDWSSVTPRVILRYELNDSSNVYASYSQGFKAGQLNPASFDITPIDQEEIDAFEVGYKTQTDSIRFDASIFSYDYTDLQVASFNGTQALVVNAAASSIKGAEFQFSKLIGDGLEFSLGVAYTDATYDKFPGSQPRDLDPTSPSYLQVLVGNADGNQVGRTPEFSGTAGVSYETQFGDGTVRLNAHLYFTDDFFFDANEQIKQDAYQLLNLRATWMSPDEKLSVSLYGKNVTDEEYLIQVLPGNQALGQAYGEPSVYGIELGLKF